MVLLFLTNSSIDKKMMPHTIDPFQVYSPTVFWILTELRNHHHNQS